MEVFYGLTLPLAKVSVNVDNEKCLGPLKCRKCLQICPQAVFFTYPTKRERNKICDEWRILPTHERLCTGCVDLCVKVCPTKAIKIEPKHS